MARLRLPFIVLSALLAVLALAFQEPVEIKRSPKVDDLAKYRVSYEFSVAGAAYVYSALLTQKVIEVKPDGNYVIESVQSELSTTVNGETVTVDQEKPPAYRTEYTPRGEIVEQKGELVNANTYRIASMGALRLPDRAVKPGDSWVSDIAENKVTGMKKASANYTYERDDKVEDWEVIVADFSYKETEGEFPSISDGKVWINRADGTLVRAEMEWNNTEIAGLQGHHFVKVLVIRVP